MPSHRTRRSRAANTSLLSEAATDCHTPGYFFGKPDLSHFLGGSEVGFEIPAYCGIPRPESHVGPRHGLGKWSAEEIVTAITTGRRPDGRVLAPIMPLGTRSQTSHGRTYLRFYDLSQELTAGKEQSSSAPWSKREADFIRDEDHSGWVRNTSRSGGEITGSAHRNVSGDWRRIRSDSLGGILSALVWPTSAHGPERRSLPRTNKTAHSGHCDGSAPLETFSLIPATVREHVRCKTND